MDTEVDLRARLRRAIKEDAARTDVAAGRAQIGHGQPGAAVTGPEERRSNTRRVLVGGGIVALLIVAGVTVLAARGRTSDSSVLQATSPDPTSTTVGPVTLPDGTIIYPVASLPMDQLQPVDPPDVIGSVHITKMLPGLSGHGSFPQPAGPRPSPGTTTSAIFQTTSVVSEPSQTPSTTGGTTTTQAPPRVLKVTISVTDGLTSQQAQDGFKRESGGRAYEINGVRVNVSDIDPSWHSAVAVLPSGAFISINGNASTNIDLDLLSVVATLT